MSIFEQYRITPKADILQKGASHQRGRKARSANSKRNSRVSAASSLSSGTINRTFSKQARGRFDVLRKETLRHIEGLMLIFRAGDEMDLRREFTSMFDDKMKALLLKIECVELEYGNGSFGQNPKEKWSVFQAEVDDLVRSFYNFIELMSRRLAPEHDEIGRVYILAEMLDGVFGAVYTSKQGLKHVWNKGILDQRQDFFCLSKILNRFPEMAPYCDEVAQSRIGPDKNESWTEVVQDLRNIRLRTIAHFVNRNDVSTTNNPPSWFGTQEAEAISSRSLVMKDESHFPSVVSAVSERGVFTPVGSADVSMKFNPIPPLVDLPESAPSWGLDCSMEDLGSPSAMGTTSGFMVTTNPAQSTYHHQPQVQQQQPCTQSCCVPMTQTHSVQHSTPTQMMVPVGGGYGGSLSPLSSGTDLSSEHYVQNSIPSAPTPNFQRVQQLTFDQQQQRQAVAISASQYQRFQQLEYEQQMRQSSQLSHSQTQRQPHQHQLQQHLPSLPPQSMSSNSHLPADWSCAIPTGNAQPQFPATTTAKTWGGRQSVLVQQLQSIQQMQSTPSTPTVPQLRMQPASQQYVVLDNARMNRLASTDSGGDYEMDYPGGNFVDEGCVFDTTSTTLLSSIEQVELARLAANGKVFNGSLCD